MKLLIALVAFTSISFFTGSAKAEPARTICAMMNDEAYCCNSTDGSAYMCVNINTGYVYPNGGR